MRHHRHEHHCGPGPAAVAGLPLVLAMSGHRGGHRGGPFGGPGWGDWGGRGGWGGPGRGRGRRSRGDVRAAILLLLDEEPRNGYGLMQEVENRSDGAWRPSPGSIYPALSQLEDEGLIAPSDAEQGKSFALTEAGRQYVEENREQLGSPWEAATRGMPEGMSDLRTGIGAVAGATMAVVQTGDEKLIASAKQILEDTRKALYRLLAGDQDEG
jgi:DNA-binding PadR family transcriptional regulator